MRAGTDRKPKTNCCALAAAWIVSLACGLSACGRSEAPVSPPAATARAPAAPAKSTGVSSPPDLAARPYDATACTALTPSLLAINGELPNQHLGFQVASADWDGDGYDDVLVSGGIQPGGPATMVWLCYGRGLASRIRFSLPVFRNEQSRAGATVAFLGDIDGGGRMDLAIGDPYWRNTRGSDDPSDDVPDAGRVFIFLGERAPPAGTTVLLDEAACAADLILEYDGEEPAWFGLSLAGGDIAQTADDPLHAATGQPRCADLLVGAPGSDVDGAPALAGQVFAFLGGPHHPPEQLALGGACAAAGQCPGEQRPVRLPASKACFRRWQGSAPRDRFGYSLAILADVHPAGGDGFRDVLIGAPEGGLSAHGRTPFVDALLDDDGQRRAGYAEVWSANGDRVARLAPLVGAGDELSLFGWSVANAGDLDGDGVPDLVVGAPGYGSRDDGTSTALVNFGAVYTFRGAARAATGAATRAATGGAAGEASAAAPHDASGGAPASALPFAALAPPITLASMRNAGVAPARGDLFGFSVAGRRGHDLDRDGHDDLLVGAPMASNPEVPGNPCGCTPTGGGFGGRAYLVALAGPALAPRALAVYRAEAPKDGFGFAVALGKLLHDGHAGVVDALCAAPRNALDCSAGSEQGELDVFFGERVRMP